MPTLKFDEKMKERIEKMDDAILNSGEELAKTELTGAVTAVGDIVEYTTGVTSAVIAAMFKHLAEESGDKQFSLSEIFEVCAHIVDKNAPKKFIGDRLRFEKDGKEYTLDIHEMMHDMILKRMSGCINENVDYLVAGFNATAINYAALVLTGKMDPIDDASLDDEHFEDAKKTAQETMHEVNMTIGMAGGMHETNDGRLALNDDLIKRAFLTKEDK